MKYDEMKVIIFIAILTLASSGDGEQMNTTEEYLSGVMADLWLEGADVVRIIWRDCSKKLVDVKDIIDHKEYFPKFVRCMKRKTLRALDRSLSPDVVPISDGVSFVRYELVDTTGNIMAENETRSWSEKELEEGDWRTLALQRMAKILRTHVIKFDFHNEQTIDKAETRGRRRHQMLTMMMFGVVSIGMVLVPMGFQFLAVLGGKALLLAKMALILASIQGLKKIATSPLSYGFYHSFPPYDHYERRSRDGWSDSGVIPPTTQPPTLYGPWSNVDGFKDRIHIADDIKIVKRATEGSLKKEETKQSSRLFPIYSTSQGSLPVYSAIDTPLVNPAPLGSLPVYSAIDTPLVNPAPLGSLPVYSAIDTPLVNPAPLGSLPVYSAIDTPLADLTTKPGEVQADYSLDLPYNGFRFQSPTTVVSA